VNGVRSAGFTSPPGVVRGGYAASTIGATLVKCQSSFFVVGKPNAWKLSNAHCRIVSNQLGVPRATWRVKV